MSAESTASRRRLPHLNQTTPFRPRSRKNILSRIYWRSISQPAHLRQKIVDTFYVCEWRHADADTLINIYEKKGNAHKFTIIITLSWNVVRPLSVRIWRKWYGGYGYGPSRLHPSSNGVSWLSRTFTSGHWQPCTKIIIFGPVYRNNHRKYIFYGNNVLPWKWH